MIMQCKFYKVYEGYIEFDKTQKYAERQKTSSPKKSVENADLYKAVLNKISSPTSISFNSSWFVASLTFKTTRSLAFLSLIPSALINLRNVFPRFLLNA